MKAHSRKILLVFIQSVFNTAQGSDSPSFFQVSPLAEKFGRFLAPSTLGGILNILSRSDPKTADLTKLDLEIRKAIEEDAGFRLRINPAKEAEDEYRKALELREVEIER